MAALVRPSKRPHVTRDHVQPGLIGPIGATALKIVTVELNPELVSAKMERKLIVPDPLLTSSSAI